MKRYELLNHHTTAYLFFSVSRCKSVIFHVRKTNTARFVCVAGASGQRLAKDGDLTVMYQFTLKTLKNFCSFISDDLQVSLKVKS